MLYRVNPLLHRVEALPEEGCYAASFLLSNGQERSMVMRVTDDEVIVPEANLIPGWPTTSESFRATLAAIRAIDQARSCGTPPVALLRDVPGGWDVSVGNMALSEDRQPICAAHGEMELTEPGTYQCPTCGALALYGDTGSNVTR
jgi:hypothetical protein